MSTALVGSFIHSVAYGKLEVIANGALLHSNGIISALVDLDKSPDALAKADRICRYEGKLIIPGFIDAHCHAPQYVFTGTGMDLGLLEWLNQYTFPTESKFNDEVFARYAYEKSVKRHLKSGTTCAAYFATLHLQASKVLADVIQACGQRSLIGKVNMDRNSPDFYVEPTNTGCMETEEFVRYVLNMTTTGKEFLKNVDSENITEKAFLTNVEPPRFDSRNTLLNKVNVPRVIPAITPRFVPTCSPEMMSTLGFLSYKYGLPVQSHLSESIGEIEWVSMLHPECETYAGVYDAHRLLHSSAIMGHCCFSSPAERKVLKAANASVVHCASSNFNLNSGIMDIRLFLADGIKVGLGTDVAGGHSASMLDCIRQTLVASRAIGFEKRSPAANIPALDGSEVDYSPIGFKELFHLATQGSADALSYGDVIGNFAVGKRLDCLVIDPNVADGPFDVFPGEDILEQFQKFLFLGDDRNIEHIFVDGIEVTTEL